MTDTIIAIYHGRIRQAQLAIIKLNGQLTVISLFRLLLFILFLATGFIAIKQRFNLPILLLSLGSLLIFLILVLLANQKKEKRNYLRTLEKINQNEVDIAEGKLSFLADGYAFPVQNDYTADLNIFGNHSLYHLLNRTGSERGKEKLRSALSDPSVSINLIRQKQQAVKALSGMLDFRQALLAHTLQINEKESLSGLPAAIPEEYFEIADSRFWKWVIIIWPIIGSFLLVLGVLKNNLQLIILFGILGLLLLSVVTRRIGFLYNHVSKKSYLFTQYAKSFDLILATPFDEPILQTQKEQLAEASKAFRQLARLVSFFDLRVSLFSFIINGLFVTDLICAIDYLKWSRKYQRSISVWIDNLGEWELLNSVGTFHYNNPTFIFPELVEGATQIEAVGMGHPLMNISKAVVNDLSIGNGSDLHLITGSNMSGKSTFLRAVGLNIILAQIGSPVFATKFLFRPVQLLSSFHHIDSLTESSSYFYAELRSLKQIIDSINASIPSLVLLDEVMRGTNSRDKHDGTAMLIQKLLGLPCITLLATHDTDLGLLANNFAGRMQNFCFESELDSAGLHFDFIKRNGVTQTTNATYLMQQMGIF